MNFQRSGQSNSSLIYRYKHRFQLFFKRWFNLPATLKKIPFNTTQPLGIVAAPFLDKEMQTACSKEGIHAHFFGEFQFKLDGKTVEIPGRKAKALLAYLLLNFSKPIHRDKLMAKFWPNSSDDSARNSLNVALHAIRKNLEKASYCRDYIVFSKDFYSFHPSLTITSDVEQFISFWKLGQQTERTQGIALAETYYQKAMMLYKGDFLEGILDEEWVDLERDNFRETYLMLLERLGSHYFDNNHFAETVQISKKMLAMDNCLERAHRRLMLCYEKMNRRDKVIRQFMECRKTLLKELKIEPSTATQAVFDRIREA